MSVSCLTSSVLRVQILFLCPVIHSVSACNERRSIEIDGGAPAKFGTVCRDGATLSTYRLAYSDLYGR